MSDYDIHQQRYDKNGVALGVNVQVSPPSPFRQDQSSVTALSDGGWVVAWVQHNSAENTASISQQRYNSSGQAVGGEAKVDVATVGEAPSSASVTALSNGGWLVTWQAYVLTGPDEYTRSKIFQEHYNSSGEAVGSKHEVYATPTSENSSPKVTMLSDGGWVVTWTLTEFVDYDPVGVEIYQRRYGPGGIALTDASRVNTIADGDQSLQSVTALKDGGWVVTWTSSTVDASDIDIYQQRYNAFGVAIGGETRVNSDTTFYKFSPSVAALSDGGWVVVWRSDFHDGLFWKTDIHQQRYDANGQVVGDEMLVDHPIVDGTNPTVAGLPNGGWVVTWQAAGIHQRYFAADVEGTSLGETLTGTSWNETLRGYAGDDTLIGGLGADRMEGGIGNDVYFVDDPEDLIIEAINRGTDSVYASVSYALRSEQHVENLATASAIGTAAIDLTGNEFDQRITGNAGQNALSGGGGDDVLAGGGDADQLVGGAGNDTYVTDSGDIIIEEFLGGTDTVQSSVSNTLGANLENLTLIGAAFAGTGNALNNVITGNALANTLSGGTGADRLVGGAGNDIYITDGGDVMVEAANGGTDTVQSSANHTLAANVENLTLTGAALVGVGNALNNVITGNTLANTLNGGGGADRLVGGAGNDTYVTDGGDVIVEAANGGTDTVRSSVNYTLGANLENLVLTGSALVGVGNTLANVITGNVLANTLNGGAGADRMIGGAGNDTYHVDNSGDVVVEAANQGTDRVISTVNHTLFANVENLTLTGSALVGTGNTLNNVITGNALANTLNGGAGADRLVGGAGNDTYYVDNAGDVVVEAANQGTDRVIASVSHALAANVENLTLTGTAVSGTGNTLANIIVGTAGNNVLAGGLGNDTLTGGAGSDSFLFNTALNRTTNVDRITDFNVAADTIRLDNAVFKGLADGWLSASAFHTGAVAADAQDRIIYNKTTGALSYDADGSGSGAAIHFATVSAGLTLTRADFYVI